MSDTEGYRTNDDDFATVPTQSTRSRLRRTISDPTVSAAGNIISVDRSNVSEAVDDTYFTPPGTPLTSRAILAESPAPVKLSPKSQVRKANAEAAREVRKESVAALALRKKIDEQAAKAKLKKDADVAAFTAKKLAHNAKARTLPVSAPRIVYPMLAAATVKATRGSSKQPSSTPAQTVTHSPLRPALRGGPNAPRPPFPQQVAQRQTSIRNGAHGAKPTDTNSPTSTAATILFEKWAMQGKLTPPASPSRPVKGGIVTDL